MNSVEGVESHLFEAQEKAESLPSLRLELSQHSLLTVVELKDRTDVSNELVHERHWLLHPSERLQLHGNLFVMENCLDQSGIIAMKIGPLLPWRGVKSPWDLCTEPNGINGYLVHLYDDQTYPWEIIHYTGGIYGRTQALHHAQKMRVPDLELNFLSNTWGDRSQDSRICEAFILSEIDAAAKLGVEVVQLDDGWQMGRSANSVHALQAQGRWEGFQKGDIKFWEPDPIRFPNGLEPVIAFANQSAIQIGLWYAPDSADEFANWEHDAKTVLHLHNYYGVRHFKFDSINTRSRHGEMNLSRLIDAVLNESGHQIIIDLDITSGCRPGYFGRMDCGPLFVANRYTDTHSYWPHHVLRMIWQLSRWVNPQRLRMMFLNSSRKTSQYISDPLAPCQINPATLFAPLMFCQPLGWFEVSNLPSDYFKTVRPLVDIWKEHRHAIHAGTIIPIGNEPDGIQWSGLMSIDTNQSKCYLLLLNGMQEMIVFDMTYIKGRKIFACQRLAGEGEFSIEHGDLFVRNMPPNSFWFALIDLF